MRKLFLFAFLFIATHAQAHEGWRHGGGHYVYRPGFGWVVPTIIGGVVGYEIAKAQQPTTVYIPTPVAPAPQIVPPSPPVGFHWEAILDAGCNCYRTVAVPN